MKTFKILITIVIALFIFSSCETTESYTTTTVKEFNELPPPIILFASAETMGMYNVTLIDSLGTITVFGNMSSFANMLGESYAVGDTIKHSKK